MNAVAVWKVKCAYFLFSFQVSTKVVVLMDKEGLIPLEALVHHNQQKKERYLLFWNSTSSSSREHYSLETKKDLDSPCYNHPGRLGIKNQLSLWRFGSTGLNCWWAGGRCVLSVCADWLIGSVCNMVATKQLMSVLYLPVPSPPPPPPHPRTICCPPLKLVALPPSRMDLNMVGHVVCYC